MNKTQRINLRAKYALNKLPRLNPLERAIRLLSIAKEVGREGHDIDPEALDVELDRLEWSV